MNKFDIHAVVNIARQAGAEIMHMRDQVVGKAEYKGDGSPVTAADRRANDIVMRGLMSLTPDIPIVSEENPESENLAIQKSHHTYWVVDPLDGTRSYIEGFDGFGVHIGLIEKGEAKAAAIYFPAQGIAYYTDGKSGAFQQKDGRPREKITVRTKQEEGKSLTVAVSWVARRRPARDDVDYHPLAAVGGDRFCQAASGKADLALTEMPFAYWDIAAAHALLKAAGGDIFDLKTGARITYPNDRIYVPPALGGDADLVRAQRDSFYQATAKVVLQARDKKPPSP